MVLLLKINLHINMMLFKKLMRFIMFIFLHNKNSYLALLIHNTPLIINLLIISVKKLNINLLIIKQLNNGKTFSCSDVELMLNPHKNNVSYMLNIHTYIINIDYISMLLDILLLQHRMLIFIIHITFMMNFIIISFNN